MRLDDPLIVAGSDRWTWIGCSWPFWIIACFLKTQKLACMHEVPQAPICIKPYEAAHPGTLAHLPARSACAPSCMEHAPSFVSAQGAICVKHPACNVSLAQARLDRLFLWWALTPLVPFKGPDSPLTPLIGLANHVQICLWATHVLIQWTALFQALQA